MGTPGTRASRSAAAPWIFAVVGLAVSLALLPSARTRAAHALERAARACVPGNEAPRLDESQYVVLARRYFEQAHDATLSPPQRLGAAEIAWAAQVLARLDLVGEAFDEQFGDLLALCDEMRDEPGFVALALTALRDHRACLTAGSRIDNRADDVLLEGLAAAQSTVDPDNGAVYLLFAQVALDAGRTLEARDLLTKAACAPTIDEQLKRRARLAENVLVDAGVETLVARDFIVRAIFSRPGALAGACVVAIAEKLEPLVERDDARDTRLALARVAERVAATALLCSDARDAAAVGRSDRDVAVTKNRAESNRDGAQDEAKLALNRSNTYLRPVRGVHDLAIVFAAMFGLGGIFIRARRVEPPKGQRRRGGALPALATACALAAPFFVLVALRMSSTWPFGSGARFVDIVCAPHPALLLLPLTVVPFALIVALVARHAQHSPFGAVRRLLFTLAFVLAFGFTWTCSVIDAIDANDARALAALVQADGAGPSSE